MRWIDGSEIDVRQYTGEALCEKLALEMIGYERELWLGGANFWKTAIRSMRLPVLAQIMN